MQFILDSTGQTTGVFIPIKEWNELKNRFKELEQEEMEIPAWHKEVIRKRMADFEHDPQQRRDFGLSLDGIEKEL